MNSQKNISKIVAFTVLLLLYQGKRQHNLFAQTTAIPDTNFEQALIDLGFDSDGIINGQVLTSDIDTVITLDISLNGIEDLTGIEDFAALNLLDVSSNELTSLDVSNNIQLKQLYASNTGTENLMISSLDLSNNVNLELLYGENLFFLESLNLKNENNSILTVTLPCEEEGVPCELTDLNCVRVDDEVAATNNEPPYSNWYIQADYFYSEDCSLNIFDTIFADINIYPSHVKSLLFIENNKHIKIEKIIVYDILAKIVLIEKNNFNQLDLSELKNGILFVKIETEHGTITKRIIKV
ncbi:T9SS type A sorting domain-containing protein [Ulvibacter litoralis]|uniref:Por secretion system C-terminal sorting domain-containing protein n=1 Tax=Ulvibacter litoralis TaxID=227084 RepID=A0A1G7IIF3_9FLAO|nr:T9SS type A sorting domain-containing protein [Ulvibacter litoralis]SDF12314.1 Por secretion system C-terminal sorting domain-containing protein [Ulvibacter litoralis]